MRKKNSDTTKAPQDIFVSVIVCPKNGYINLEQYLPALAQKLSQRYSNYEMILVDNMLPSDEIAAGAYLLDKLPCIRIIRLSRSYRHDTAIMAGIESAIGDFVVVTDPNLEDVDDITEIITLNQKTDIVQGIAQVSSKKMLDSSWGRKAFYWYSRRYLGIDVPLQATYFIALSRRAVRSVTSTARQDVYLRQILKTIGYSYETYSYKTNEDPARSTSLRTGLVEALDIISSHSTHPLRVMSWVGFVASVVNLAYALYVVLVAVFGGHVAEGWTTMSLQISGMFFILFIFMIVLSEYIGKILAETRHDSRYLVMDELTSTVSIADVDRKNVSKD